MVIPKPLPFFSFFVLTNSYFHYFKKGESKMTNNQKGLVLIGIGLLLLLANGWVTVRLLTLGLSLVVINYGLLKMGKPSLIDSIRQLLGMLKFW